MRVLHLLDTDRIAGTEIHVLALAKAMQILGVESWLGCCAGGALMAEAVRAGVPVIALGKSSLTPKSLWSIHHAIRRMQIDVVHAHNGRTSLCAAITVSSAGPGAVVATQHFIEPSRLRRRGIKALVSKLAHRWVERRTARIIAISAAVREAMLRRGDAAAQKISVVPNGIGLPKAQSTAGSQRLRSELGVPSGSPMIACISRLEAEKDVGTLVDAMAIVIQRESKTFCVVAGEGSQREAIERKIADLGLKQCVRLLGFRNDVNAIINAFDFVVLPCPIEGFGLVILEAMALAKPVVATAAGGPLEIVVPGETGLLVPPSNPPALAAGILTLVADAQLRKRMGRAGHQRFLSHYTADRMAADTVAVYRSVVTNARTSCEVATAPASAGNHVPLEATHGGD